MRMSAADYRKQFIEPLAQETSDQEFLGMVKQIDDKQAKKNRSKTKQKYEPLEHDIQNNILERLRFIKNGFFWRENSGAFKLGDGNKKRFFRAGLPGIADIMGVWNGVAIAIEVKRPKTKNNVSMDQKAFINRFKECGGVAIICWDDATVIKQLEEEIEKLNN